MTIGRWLLGLASGMGIWIGGASIASAADGPTVLYLHRDGGRIAAGFDDATRRRSSVLAARGYELVDVPAFKSGDKAWDSVLTCVQEQFADFDVRVVDERPEGDHIMAMIGGSSGMLGFPKGVAGIAPFRGRPIDNAVVFVFENTHRDTRSLCETTAHELGHALGLDHSRLCSDTMSYGSCGPKEFRKREAACGELSDRACTDGSDTQSSWHALAHHVGTEREERIAQVSPPTRHPTVNPRRSPAGPPRVTPPPTRVTPPARPGNANVRVASPTRARGNGVFVVQVDARDSDGIKSVEIVWEQPGRTRRLQCGKSDPKLPFACARRGSVYTFALSVGTGPRRFAVRVTDGRGQVTTTSPRRVQLG